MVKRLTRPTGERSPMQSEVMDRMARAAEFVNNASESDGHIDASALAHVDDLIIGGMHFTQTGLVPVEDLTEDGLRLVTDVLYRFKGSFQWLMGDLLNAAGVYEWGDIKRVAIHFRLAVKTLQNWKYVSSGVPHALRRAELNFNHHALVMGMPESKQRYWLEKAVWGDETPDHPEIRKRWSVARLRKEIEDSQKQNREGENGGTTLLDRAEKKMSGMMARWTKKTVTRDQRQAIAAHLRRCAAELERD